jgi:hypothetical protein
MSYHRRNKRPQGPRFGQPHAGTNADGMYYHRQREYIGYGFSHIHFVGTLEQVLAATEREKTSYPMNGYGGHYCAPEDLGDGLFLVYIHHSESCE